MKPDWITPEGFFDPTKFPIDGVLRQALDEDAELFHGACTMLATMASHDRREAGIFLLGLLSYYQDDLEWLSSVVQALRAFPTRQAMDALTAELRRVPSTPSTRGYLNAVLEALTGFPGDLVCDRLGALAADKSFSVKWRKKFEAAFEYVQGYPASDDDYW
jgi:hypothetical protein